MKKKIKFLVMLIVILALALSACANQQTPTIQNDLSVVPVNTVIAEGHIKPIHAVNLSFQARGSVAEISVKIGDHVSRGDVLVRLSNASLAEAQLAAANLELINAQQVLDVLARNGDGNRAAAWDTYQKAQVARAATQKKWNEVNPRDIQKRIDDQQATVNDREQSLQDAQDEFDKYKDLDRENSKRKTAEDKLRSAQKDYDTAVEVLGRYLEYDPDVADFWFYLSIAQKRLGKYESSLQAAEKFEAIQPDNIQNLVNLSDLHRILGRTEEALAYSKKAIELDPENRSAKKIAEILQKT